MGVFERHIVLADVEMMGFDPRQHPVRRLHIIGDDHKFHIRTYLLHLRHALEPVFLMDQKFRASRIFSAPHVDDAQIFSAVFVGIVFRLYLKPLPDLRQVSYKVGLVLHVAIEQRIVLHIMDSRIGARHITSVRQIVSGIPDIQSGLHIVVDLILLLFFLRYGFPQIYIHEIHTPVTVYVYRKTFLSGSAELVAVLERDRSGRHITE